MRTMFGKSKNKARLMIAVIFALLLGTAIPVSAAPSQYPSGSQNYTFYIYHDGNANGYLDYYSGQDTCYRGNRDMGLYRTVNGNTTTIATVDIPSGSDYTVNSFSTYWSCLHTSPVYSIAAPVTGNQFWLGKQMSFHFFDTYYSSDPDVTFAEGLKY